MEIGGLAGVFHKICSWFVRFAYINLLWILFTIIGLFLFGFFPATVAMCTIIRKWLHHQEDVPIFKTFWRTFKKEWIKANGLGIVILAIGYLLYACLVLLQGMQGFIYFLLYFSSFSLVFLYLMVVCFAIPVYIQYQTSWKETLKQSFILGIAHPFHTIGLFVGIFTTYLILDFIQFKFFFLGSVMAFVIMYMTNHVFEKVQLKISAEREGLSQPVIE
ncbi:YesL family protein [Gracilibacillus sp. YIM 98692]|uniref:YesL family protein n=1 Tax=Gracilibacillus sp. YIM 98692 TaxID=2663532 RepID=UPI0013D44A09|nr:YesL family protein [Gracilibacillus sp. YIM 98692]